jgi:hypothetical protein
MLVRQVALVSETQTVSSSDLGRVSAALQKQAVRDLGPIWEVQSTVDAFSKLEDVPLGYWPVIVRDDINTPGAAGLHEDKDGQPFALVQASEGWSLTASHEVLEMLVDPFGSRLVAGQSPKRGQGRVEFLVEVCDPSEDSSFAYTVNGVTVSDFYTPHYFDPVTNPSVRYSFTAAIKNPRKVLKGGYLSWHDPVSDHWFQEIFFSGTKPTFRDIGQLTAEAGQNIRTQVLNRTPEAFAARRPASKSLLTARALVKAASKSTNSKADAWHEQIATLTVATLTVKKAGNASYF